MAEYGCKPTYTRSIGLEVSGNCLEQTCSVAISQLWGSLPLLRTTPRASVAYAA